MREGLTNRPIRSIFIERFLIESIYQSVSYVLARRFHASVGAVPLAVSAQRFTDKESRDEPRSARLREHFNDKML